MYFFSFLLITHSAHLIRLSNDANLFEVLFIALNYLIPTRNMSVEGVWGVWLRGKEGGEGGTKRKRETEKDTKEILKYARVCVCLTLELKPYKN